MHKADSLGMAETREAVMDEAGDTFYGAMCYTVAWAETTRNAWKGMVDNWHQHNEGTPTETESGIQTQTMADNARWNTAPTVMETALQRAAVTKVTKI